MRTFYKSTFHLVIDKNKNLEQHKKRKRITTQKEYDKIREKKIYKLKYTVQCVLFTVLYYC